MYFFLVGSSALRLRWDKTTQAVWVWQWDILLILCHTKNISKKLLTRADPDKIRLGRHPCEVFHL
jgi:hypothetical protein